MLVGVCGMAWLGKFMLEGVENVLNIGFQECSLVVP